MIPDVGDLVYIHEAYGPLPENLFAVVTHVVHRLPHVADCWPLVRVELYVFKEKAKICSWYEPKHLTILEKRYEEISTIHSARMVAARARQPA